MQKIYTIRDLERQQEHLWSATQVSEEVAACPLRCIEEHFLRHLPRGEKILEAGCGLGAWVVYLGDRGYAIEGVDHDGRVLERLRQARPGLPVYEGDICRLPYADEEIGAYISLGVVEHFEEGCDEALREAWRVLRPGGLLFLTVPLENPFRRLFAHPLRRVYLAWRRRRGDRIHFAEYRFRPQEVRDLLLRAGFEVIETSWDDFVPRRMSLGLWADFPPLHSERTYRLSAVGSGLAWILNSLSRWLAAGGVFCLARKPSPARALPGP